MQRTRLVLVVEDELQLRRCLAAYLKRRGWDVTEAGSIAEAHAELAAMSFDAAVVDVGLPDGDGLELLARTDPRHSLVVSARPDAERYEHRGVLHHLAKPLDLVTVAERVSSLCANSERTDGSVTAGGFQ